MAENASAAAHASATAARTRAETRTHTPSYEGVSDPSRRVHDRAVDRGRRQILPLPGELGSVSLADGRAHAADPRPHVHAGVGIIEIVAALLVALRPAIGAWVVGLWLCGIIVNLLTIPAYFDVALRDFGLALGAFALARLAAEYDRR